MRFRPSIFVALTAWVVAACPPPGRAAFQESTPAPQSPSPSPTPAQQFPATSDDKLCTIAGNVVSANTGEPLRRAHIELTDRATSNAIPFEVLSDPAGHFTLDHVPAGRYDMTVYRDNYVGTHYGQTGPHQSGAVLSLTAGQKMTDLLFRLWKSAAISGRVVDINGDPVQDVQVTADARRMHKGKMETVFSTSANTNDLGEYRIFGIQPGRYILTAEAQNSRRVYRHPPPQEFAQVYYPDTSDAARASLIELKSGDDISGMDLTLPPVVANRGYRVHGRVQNNIEGANQYFMAVLLRPRTSAGGGDDQKFAEADRKTGEFEFDNVVPGDYVLTALLQSSAGHNSASQPVAVVASDIDSVILVLSKGVAIPAHLVTEGKAASAASGAFLYLVSRDDDENPFRSSYESVAQKDGSYVWDSVNDGNYRLAVHSDCKECYVKAADANGVDVLARGVQVSGGAGPGRIDILYSSETATVNGTVTNKDDLPAAGATVVIIPADARIKPEDYKTISTDQYGHFEVRGLPPGHYTAYAFDTDDEDTYSDPETIKHFEGKGASVEVAANDRNSADLKLIITNDPAN